LIHVSVIRCVVVRNDRSHVPAFLPVIIARPDPEVGVGPHRGIVEIEFVFVIRNRGTDSGHAEIDRIG